MFKIRKLFPNSKWATPTAVAETTSPLPNRIETSPSRSGVEELSVCSEEHMWLVAPESTIQACASSSTKQASKASKSYLPCFLFFSPERYFLQFLFQWPSTPQWKHFPFGSLTLELFFFFSPLLGALLLGCAPDPPVVFFFFFFGFFSSSQKIKPTFFQTLQIFVVVLAW